MFSNTHDWYELTCHAPLVQTVSPSVPTSPALRSVWPCCSTPPSALAVPSAVLSTASRPIHATSNETIQKCSQNYKLECTIDNGDCEVSSISMGCRYLEGAGDTVLHVHKHIPRSPVVAYIVLTDTHTHLKSHTHQQAEMSSNLLTDQQDTTILTKTKTPMATMTMNKPILSDLIK